MLKFFMCQGFHSSFCHIFMVNKALHRKLWGYLMDYSSHLPTELEDRVRTAGIDDFIRTKLAKVKTDDDLVEFFRRFALYNQSFPGGVLSLAGAFHVRDDIFRDVNDPISDNRDRSLVIASHIAFVAEDEFALKNRTHRITHRMMAQDVVKEAISYAGWSVKQFNDRFMDETEYRQKASALKNGYRLGKYNTDRDLFSGLGFHLGSERLADIEFNAVNDLMKNHFPEFVAQANQSTGSTGVPVYGWISVHTSVEVDHYDYSMKAAIDSLTFYNEHEISQKDAYNEIINGFDEFVTFQQNMFQWLG